jgi:hypothetical protein
MSGIVLFAYSAFKQAISAAYTNITARKTGAHIAIIPYYLLLILAFTTLSSNTPPEIVLTRKNMGGKVSLLMPENFFEQGEAEMALRFPSNRKPVSLYSNLAKTVDLSLNVSNTVWDEKDIELLLDFYRANIKSLYVKVNFSLDEVQKIKGKKFAVFEFTCETVDQTSGRAPLRKYIYIQYTVFKGKVMVLHLDCPIGEQSIWKPVAPKIMKSVKITA